MSDDWLKPPSEEDLRKARAARGGAVFDAIAVHGQDQDYKRQPVKRGGKSPKRAYCERHHTYFCPCVAAHLYCPPFTQTNEIAQAMKDWDDGANLRASRKRAR